MGFQNPRIPWHELERRLSGRLAPPAGDDQPADREDGWSAAVEFPASRKRTPYAGRVERPASAVPYAELHAHSSFSFLDGASSPEKMAEEAVRLGLTGLTITDHDGVYGLVRFAEAAKDLHLPTAFGVELNLDVPLPPTRSEQDLAVRAAVPDPPGTHLLALARNPTGYATLSCAIGRANLRSGVKGRPAYDLDELADAADGNLLILTGCRKGAVRQALDQHGVPAARRTLAELIDRFGHDNVAVELTHELGPLADERYEVLVQLADERQLPIVATTGAHFDAPARAPLATALAAVRARRSLDEIDGWLPAWSGQHLRSGAELAERFARWPQAITNAVDLHKQIAFELKLIAPKLPPFPVPPGHNEMSYLRELAYAGMRKRYDKDANVDKAYRMIEHELAIIEEKDFPGYFLVVWDIVRFCRERGILCQGRGSAANSVVCYALMVTAVDPVLYDLMFERFLAPERGEAPDIDVDIESGRREEAIQYVYDRHGRKHAAQVANVISYRPKSAIRDIAKALGYSPGQQDAWSKHIEQSYYWSSAVSDKGGGDAPFESVDGSGPLSEERAKGGCERTGHPHRPTNASSDPHRPTNASSDPQLSDIPTPVLQLAAELQNAPRHLGIHSGGMVMCDRPVIEVCPVEWGRMENRTVLQWDKDDCAEIGLVKFDLLGLGMLSALRYTFELIEQHHGISYDLDSIPKEQPCVYDMLCAADTIGVFQVESRAQMATLPRLKPREFYDLVIEVALIRPGPIQGNSVHPYIRRRDKLEPITYPHPRMEGPLHRTKGVPLFQEQLMQLAVAVADFSPSEADQLRRAMGSKRGVERIDALRIRLYDGMAANGITGRVAHEIYEKIQAFAAFGFAESHAISFALLVYASSWLKRHYPAAFCAALINAQPMGFYSVQSLVHDAKRHGIEVRPPSLSRSLAGASLEDDMLSSSQCGCLDAPQPAVRLGLSSVRTIGADVAAAIVAERMRDGAFASLGELARRVGLTVEQLEALAAAGALDLRCEGSEESSDRRALLWAAGAAATIKPGQLAVDLAGERPPEGIPAMTAPEQLIADLWATGVTTDQYPTALIRPRLTGLGIISNAALRELPDRTRVLIGGVVTHRQRPGTARGITFLNIEDETGMVNVIVDPVVWDRHRRVARESGGLMIRGMLERTGEVINVAAERIDKLSLGVRVKSRDFR